MCAPPHAPIRSHTSRVALTVRHLSIAQAAAKKRLAPIRKVVGTLLDVPQGRDPSQSKKSIEAQESAIAALKNLEWYDLADPGLLSQLAVLNKRFPWPPELRGAPELPDESRDTIPWLPVEVRDAIRWMFCNPRLNRMELQTCVEIVFAKLEGDACDYVLSCLEEDPIVQKDLLDAIQSLESNDDLNQSVLATLRLRIVRNLHPFRMARS